MSRGSDELYATTRLPTEQRNPRTVGIDHASTLDTLALLNAEDATVANAVAQVLPALAQVVDLAEERVRSGGRVHYFGAGTSGRLAVLDAAELLPTFNLNTDTVVAHHAGGPAALVGAVENIEDSAQAGHDDAESLTAADLAIGLAASGRTPYVGGALRAARERGAATSLMTSNPNAPLAEWADVVVAPDTGPEAIAGSTRLKAGTAQKFMLNGFSTALMVRLGRTYSNFMVDVVATNEKLRRRTVAILVEASGAPLADAHDALAATEGELKPALVVLLTGTDAASARQALADSGGVVARAVAASASSPS